MSKKNPPVNMDVTIRLAYDLMAAISTAFNMRLDDAKERFYQEEVTAQHIAVRAVCHWMEAALNKEQLDAVDHVAQVLANKEIKTEGFGTELQNPLSKMAKQLPSAKA